MYCVLIVSKAGLAAISRSRARARSSSSSELIDSPSAANASAISSLLLSITLTVASRWRSSISKPSAIVRGGTSTTSVRQKKLAIP